MDSSDLTPEMAEKIRNALAPQLVYLRKLTDRMRARGWPFHDDLFIATSNARDSVAKVVAMLNRISRPARLETIGERAERRREQDRRRNQVSTRAVAAWSPKPVTHSAFSAWAS
jgi:hypothetical protein